MVFRPSTLDVSTSVRERARVTGSTRPLRAQGRRQLAWQAVAALFTVVLLFGHVFHAVHLLTARHAVCPEHGELVHRDGPARDGGSATPGGRRAAVEGTAPAAHHHDHCGVFTMSRVPGTTTWDREVSVGAAAFGAIALAPGCGLLRGAGLCVLAYAPKQGPPA
jgi:hypothetical protein